MKIDHHYGLHLPLSAWPRLPAKHLLLASKMLEKIDPKDIQYLGLSLQLDLILLTRDKPLYKGLRKQGYRKVILFEDFLKGV
jgi:predicted nucleic acid-binding protein